MSDSDLFRHSNSEDTATPPRYRRRAHDAPHARMTQRDVQNLAITLDVHLHARIAASKRHPSNRTHENRVRAETTRSHERRCKQLHRNIHQVTHRHCSALEGILVLLDGVYVLPTVHIDELQDFFTRARSVCDPATPKNSRDKPRDGTDPPPGNSTKEDHGLAPIGTYCTITRPLLPPLPAS